MPDVKISALPAAGALGGTEPVPIVQSGDTKITTVQDIANMAPGGGGTFIIAAAGTIDFDTTTGSRTILQLKDSGGIDLFMETGSSTMDWTSGGVSQVSLVYAASVLGFLMGTQNFKVILGGGGTLEVLGGFNQLLIQGMTTCTYQLTGLAGGSWGGPGTPVDLNNAIDRLAAAVAGLLGGGVP